MISSSSDFDSPVAEAGHHIDYGEINEPPRSNYDIHSLHLDLQTSKNVLSMPNLNHTSHVSKDNNTQMPEIMASTVNLKFGVREFQRNNTYAGKNNSDIDTIVAMQINTTYDNNISTSSLLNDWNNSIWNITTAYNSTEEWLNATSDDNAIIDLLDGYPFPSKFPWEHIILSALVVTLIIIGIILGNMLIIVAVIRDRNLNQVQNYFIASLAVSDLLLGLLIMPLSLANELMGYWYFGEVFCDLWLSIDVLLCTASILNLCLISLDRYWSVTRAVSYVKQRTRKRAFIMIALVWILSMIICFPPLAGWKRPQPQKFGYPLCVLSAEIGYVVYSTMGSFYIPLIVMVVVYFKIYLAARSRARRALKRNKQHHVPDNGKSASTTTTTSFSNPTKCDVTETIHDLSSEEEQPEPSDDMSVTDSVMEQSYNQPDIKLTVTNHNARFRPADEKRLLLADDTDSACETQPPKDKKERKIHFSEDTDSMSDCGFYNKHAAGYAEKDVLQQKRDENLKPLLQTDSQVDSDSQKESDRNCNKISAPGINRSLRPADIPKVEITISDNRDKRKKKIKIHFRETKNKTKMDLLTPVNLRRLSLRRQQKEKQVKDDPERMKRKIARAKERRAILVLGIIMATFIACWLPFFTIYLVSTLSGLNVPDPVFAIIFWAGYCNSALNPIIYTIFNRDFRQAFHRLICGRRRK